MNPLPKNFSLPSWGLIVQVCAIQSASLSTLVLKLGVLEYQGGVLAKEKDNNVIFTNGLFKLILIILFATYL